MDDKLFPDAINPRPYKVALPYVTCAVNHYKVRCFLLELKWEEFTDWMISPCSLADAGEYEIWFTDIAKATYFKLSFDL